MPYSSGCWSSGPHGVLACVPLAVAARAFPRASWGAGTSEVLGGLFKLPRSCSLDVVSVAVRLITTLPYLAAVVLVPLVLVLVVAAMVAICIQILAGDSGIPSS